MTDEFPGNSKRQKKAAVEAEEPKVVTKVISGTVVRKKTPLGTRFKNLFLTGEDARSVLTFMFTEHIRPGIRDIIYDAANAGLHRKLYGDAPIRRASNSPATSLLTNYAGISRGPAGSLLQPEPAPRLSRAARQNHNFSEFAIPTKPEAELVLETMIEIIGRHDECTVADFMGLIGETPDFTHEKWGWTNLQGARPRRSPGGGYVLDLPPTESLT